MSSLSSCREVSNHIPLELPITTAIFLVETLVSVVKRLFGEYMLHQGQQKHIIENRRCLDVAYNMHRITDIVIIVMVST